MGRKRKLKWWQWLTIGVVLLFTLIPDPSDALDFMLPIVEPLLAGALYYYWRGG